MSSSCVFINGLDVYTSEPDGAISSLAHFEEAKLPRGHLQRLRGRKRWIYRIVWGRVGVKGEVRINEERRYEGDALPSARDTSTVFIA